MLFLQHTRHRIFYNKLLNNNSGDLTCCQQIGFVKGIVIKITFKSVQFNVEKWMLFLQHDQLWNLDNNLLINNSGILLAVNKLMLPKKLLSKLRSRRCNLMPNRECCFCNMLDVEIWTTTVGSFGVDKLILLRNCYQNLVLVQFIVEEWFSATWSTLKFGQ